MPPRSSQADRVYETLRQRLVQGELPFGRRLVERQLADELGTSRTPVREALRMLEGDGHLERDPSGGLRPRLPSVRSMRELYDVRLVIEELAVRRATAAGDRGALEALQQDWQALAIEERQDADAVAGAGFVRHDETFHVGLAAASGNRIAAELLGDLNERIRVLRIHDFATRERVEATIREHLEIIAAILAGDADAASDYMRSHVQRSAAVVRERIGSVLTRMFEESGEPAGGGVAPGSAARD